MTISEHKTRRSVTLKNENLDYLKMRAEEESEIQQRKVTVSEIIDKLAEGDRTIRQSFNFK